MAIAIQYKKCKVLHFGVNNPKIDYVINYEATQVYIDNCSESDLKVIIVPNLLLDNHIDKAVKKANQAIGAIKRTFTFLNKCYNLPI